MARSVRILPPDSPQARKVSSLAASRRAASNGASWASSRPQIAAPAASEICWSTTMRSSPAMPPLLRRTAGSPVLAAIAPNRGSARASSATAAATSSAVSMVVAVTPCASLLGLTRDRGTHTHRPRAMPWMAFKLA
jgi:hypothetical protein